VVCLPQGTLCPTPTFLDKNQAEGVQNKKKNSALAPEREVKSTKRRDVDLESLCWYNKINKIGHNLRTNSELAPNFFESGSPFKRVNFPGNSDKKVVKTSKQAKMWNKFRRSAPFYEQKNLLTKF
jgi:hypothetical protein